MLDVMGVENRSRPQPGNRQPPSARAVHGPGHGGIDPGLATDRERLAVALDKGYDGRVTAEPARRLRRQGHALVEGGGGIGVSRAERREVDVDDDLMAITAAGGLGSSGDRGLGQGNEGVGAIGPGNRGCLGARLGLIVR